jgi:hypothetical protein
MAQAQRSPAGSARHANGEPEMTAWVGWVLFAGVIMFTVGFFNVIQGLVALLNSALYRTPRGGLPVVENYAAWGWALLIFGVILCATGYGVMVGRTWARVVGVIVAALNALANMAFVAAYPIWITMTIALNVLAIFALVVHGGETKALRQR